MQVDGREVVADLEQQACLVEPDQGIAELELRKDDPCVVREAGHVVQQIYREVL